MVSPVRSPPAAAGDPASLRPADTPIFHFAPNCYLQTDELRLGLLVSVQGEPEPVEGGDLGNGAEAGRGREIHGGAGLQAVTVLHYGRLHHLCVWLRCPLQHRAGRAASLHSTFILMSIRLELTSFNLLSGAKLNVKTIFGRAARNNRFDI